MGVYIRPEKTGASLLWAYIYALDPYFYNLINISAIVGQNMTYLVSMERSRHAICLCDVGRRGGTRSNTMSSCILSQTGMIGVMAVLFKWSCFCFNYCRNATKITATLLIILILYTREDKTNHKELTKL